MAQLLIFNQDNVHDDPIINERDCYKQGDIIVIKPDDHTWGLQEHPQIATSPKFWIVQYNNISDTDIEYLTAQHMEIQDETITILLQRLWKFDSQLLPSQQFSELMLTGMLVLDWETDSVYIKNKLTNLSPSTP
jgi:hypothetical protein